VQAPFNAVGKQIRSYAADAKASPTEVSSILEQRIRGVQEEAGLAETGRVLSVGYVKNGEHANIIWSWSGRMDIEAYCAVLLVMVLPVCMA
jgi:hypothetical protein